MIETVASRCGSLETPVLFIDLDRVTTNLERLRSALPGVRVFYSVKSNNDPDLIAHLRDLGSDFDAATWTEIRLVQALGVSPERILFSNPIKAEGDIRAAYASGVRGYVFDSEEELLKLARLAPRSDVILRVMVDSRTSQCPLYNKYGAHPEVACGLLRAAVDLGLSPLGLTFHVGSQCLDPSAWEGALAIAAAVWHDAGQAAIDLKVLDLGGGIPVSYDPDDDFTVLSVEEIGDLAKTVREDLDGLESVYVEPGRYMTDQAAVMVATVIGRATRGTAHWLYLDVGVFNGLFEVLEDFRYAIRTDRAETGRRVTYTVAGPSCDGLDIIRRDVRLPETRIGDRVYILNAGAYSISKQAYNGLAYPTCVSG